MRGDIGPHVPDDVLEKYSLRRLSERETAPVEEHLLVCAVCRAQCEEWEEFIEVSRAALREGLRKPAHRAYQLRLGALQSWLTVSVMAAAAAAILTTAMLMPPHAAPGAKPAEVRLYAMRGSGATLPQVQSPGSLRLDLAAEELPPGTAYQVEIVDASGSRVWNGAAPRLGTWVTVSVDRSFPPGRYWVRLRRGGELIHEYGLEVR